MTNNKIYEVGKVRKMVIELHDLIGMDKRYIFYYDETNNARKFRLKEGDFNASVYENFVLGGIVHYGSVDVFDIDELFSKLKFQKTIKEMKLKNIVNNSEYISSLCSKRLNIFLEWLNDNNLFIHYSNMNNLYFGVVDIVDSVITNYINIDIRFVNMLKDTLYRYIKNDIEFVKKLFCEFKYPNILKGDCDRFCNYLIDWIEGLDKESNMDDFYLEYLRQSLKQARKNKELVFLHDNSDYILMEDFSIMYMEQIYMFLNSNHIFDEETEVFKEIENYRIEIFGKKLNNYVCVESINDRRVQISDVIIGHLGKYFTFINKTEVSEYDNIIGRLNEMQLENIVLLNRLILKSEKENRAFIHNVCCFSDIDKYNIFFEMATKRYEVVKSMATNN